MATRNFIQQGAAYGTTIASIVVTLDGKEIYSGPAPTVDQPLPPMPGTDIDDIAFEFTLPADFTGSLPLTVQVTGSTFVLADSLADRSDYANTESFVGLNYTQTVDGQTFVDPFTDVTIGGQPMTRDSNLGGQWYWTIQPGQTFTANLHVTAGITYPDWAADQTYPPYSRVVYQSRVWNDGQNTSSAGTIPTNTPATWFTIPVPAWDTNNSYPIYSRVSSNNDVYMATQNVPTGIDISDTQYWTYQFPLAPA